jgi:hypothetical protein
MDEVFSRLVIGRSGFLLLDVSIKASHLILGAISVSSESVVREFVLPRCHRNPEGQVDQGVPSALGSKGSVLSQRGLLNEIHSSQLEATSWKEKEHSAFERTPATINSCGLKTTANFLILYIKIPRSFN